MSPPAGPASRKAVGQSEQARLRDHDPGPPGELNGAEGTHAAVQEKDPLVRVVFRVSSAARRRYLPPSIGMIAAWWIGDR